ncbi:hypothetical protein X777_03628, partial [Ooceraea biroi]
SPRADPCKPAKSAQRLVPVRYLRQHLVAREECNHAETEEVHIHAGYLPPNPRWNMIALRDRGKFEMLIPSRAHRMSSSRTGARHSPLNKFDTNAGGLRSGSRNMC